MTNGTKEITRQAFERAPRGLLATVDEMMDVADAGTWKPRWVSVAGTYSCHPILDFLSSKACQRVC